MRLSKLQTCLFILQFTARNELILKQISLQLIGSNRGIEYFLELLLKNKLIKERVDWKINIKYSSTPKGDRILQYFRSNLTSQNYAID